MAVINGTNAGETLIGTAEDDVINGYGGNDHLQGSEGNDIINGGAGNNFIYFYKGHGQDTIQNGGGEDTLVFANNILYSDISFELGEGNDKDLYIHYGQGDSVIIKNFQNCNHSTTTVKIEGTLYKIRDILNGQGKLFGTAGADKLIGGAANETIIAGAGRDIIQGGKGNDILDGGAGSNDMYFYVGDGQDTVKNGGGEDNLIINTSGLTLADINFVKGVDGDKNLYINYGNEDQITVEGYLNGNHSAKYLTVGGTKYEVLITVKP